MSKRIAVLIENIVVSVILADSAELAEELTGHICIESENANVGFVFDEELNAVIPAKPYESWLLNEEQTDWIAPVEKPEGDYLWNEEDGAWDEVVPEEVPTEAPA